MNNELSTEDSYRSRRQNVFNKKVSHALQFMVEGGLAFRVSMWHSNLTRDLQRNITFFPSSNCRFLSRVIVLA